MLSIEKFLKKMVVENHYQHSDFMCWVVGDFFKWYNNECEIDASLPEEDDVIKAIEDFIWELDRIYDLSLHQHDEEGESETHSLVFVLRAAYGDKHGDDVIPTNVINFNWCKQIYLDWDNRFEIVESYLKDDPI